MRFSYIGLKEPASEISPYLLSFIKSYRHKEPTMPPLEAGGVYCTDFQESALFACENDMAVYTSASDVIKSSDILFCFLSDKALRSLKNDLKGHGIQNKIFCHFSHTYDSDVLDFDDRNTYISLYVPMFERVDDNTRKPTHVFVEGYGPKYDDFLYMCQILSIPVYQITKEDKLILKTALNFISDFKKYIDDRAKKLLNIALYDKPEFVDDFLSKSRDEKFCVNAYDAIENSDIRYIETQNEMLNDIGIDDISTLFASLLLAKAKNKDDNSALSKKLKDMLVSFIQK